MKNIFLLFFLLFFLVSCDKEQINFDDLDIASGSLNFEIVIDGFISTEKSICEIQLSKPIAIKDSIRLVPIDDATITLSSNTNIYSFHLDDKGRYISDDSIKGELGIVYILEVSYNNNTYTASDEIPPTNDLFDFPINTVEAFKENNDDLLTYQFLEHNFGFQKPLVWMFREGHINENGNFELPLDELRKLSRLRSLRIYSHKGSIPQGLFPAGFSATGATGRSTDSLEIIKLAISDDYYEYLLSVFNSTDWDTGIFSTLAGNVKTNVSHGGIGYFYTLNAKRKRLTYEELQ